VVYLRIPLHRASHFRRGAPRSSFRRVVYTITAVTNRQPEQDESPYCPLVHNPDKPASQTKRWPLACMAKSIDSLSGLYGYNWGVYLPSWLWDYYCPAKLATFIASLVFLIGTLLRTIGLQPCL